MVDTADKDLLECNPGVSRVPLVKKLLSCPSTPREPIDLPQPQTLVPPGFIKFRLRNVRDLPERTSLPFPLSARKSEKAFPEILSVQSAIRSRAGRLFERRHQSLGRMPARGATKLELYRRESVSRILRDCRDAILRPSIHKENDIKWAEQMIEKIDDKASRKPKAILEMINNKIKSKYARRVVNKVTMEDAGRSIERALKRSHDSGSHLSSVLHVFDGVDQELKIAMKPADSREELLMTRAKQKSRSSERRARETQWMERLRHNFEQQINGCMQAAEELQSCVSGGRIMDASRRKGRWKSAGRSGRCGWPVSSRPRCRRAVSILSRAI